MIYTSFTSLAVIYAMGVGVTFGYAAGRPILSRGMMWVAIAFWSTCPVVMGLLIALAHKYG